jgi:hypothetical protein
VVAVVFTVLGKHPYECTYLAFFCHRNHLLSRVLCKIA